MTFNVAISGGTGFCGKKIIEQLLQHSCKVYGLSRSAGSLPDEVQFVEFDLNDAAKLSPIELEGVDVFIHTAALVHKTGMESENYSRMNLKATELLFEKCVVAGVKHFIFLSSVAVFGLYSADRALKMGDPEAPTNDFGWSKLHAEHYLIEQGADKGIQTSILRLPLVFGKDAPGNFGLISRISSKSVPLPLKGVNNQRSMISVDSLARFVVFAIWNPSLVAGVHIISDGSVLSTYEIVEKTRQKMGKKVRLFRFPKTLVFLGLKLLGKQRVYENLFGSLVFESSIDLAEIDCVVGANDPTYFIALNQT